MLSLIDEFLFYFFFNPAVNNPLVGDTMVIITNWSSKLFAVIYLLTVALLIWKRDKIIIPVLVAPIVAVVVVQLIRYFYLRPRPFVMLEIDSLIYHAANGSLPSMHAASAFVIATAIWCVNKRIGKYILLLATITGISRVMVGVHFPLDIMLGAVLGIFFSISVFKITTKLLQANLEKEHREYQQ